MTLIATISRAVSFDVHRHNRRVIASHDDVVVFLPCFYLGISKGAALFGLLLARIFLPLLPASIALAYFDIRLDLLLSVVHLYLHWCQSCRLITRFAVKLRTLMNTDAQSILSVLIYATPNWQIGPSVVRHSPSIHIFDSLNLRGLSLLTIIYFVE